MKDELRLATEAAQAALALADQHSAAASEARRLADRASEALRLADERLAAASAGIDQLVDEADADPSGAGEVPEAVAEFRKAQQMRDEAAQRFEMLSGAADRAFAQAAQATIEASAAEDERKRLDPHD